MYVEEKPQYLGLNTQQVTKRRKERANVAAHITFDLTYVDYAQTEQYGEKSKKKSLKIT